MFEKFINDLKNDKLKFATICVAIVAFISGIVVTAANSGNTYASDATTTSTEACYACNSDSNILKWDTSATSDSACPAGYHGLATNERTEATCKTYTVTIDRNNGTTNSTIKKAHGSSFNLDSYEPTRTGYIFKGWEDKDGNTISGGTVTVTSNLSFSAIWENNTYVVNFYSDGKKINSVTKNNGDKLDLSAYTPTKVGYTFKGWDTLSTADTVRFKSTDTVSINWNLYAVWVEESVKRHAYFYLVQVDGATFKDGTTNASFECTISEGKDSCTITAPEAVKDGYTFKGWYTKGPSVVGGKCENLKDDNGNVVAGKGTVSKGEKVTLYRTKDEAAGKYTTISYYACFTKNSSGGGSGDSGDTPSTGEYNIKYTLNGGTNASGNPTSAKKDAEVTINHPTKSFDVTCDKNNTGATIGTAPKATFAFQGWTSSDLDTSTAMYGSTKWSNGSTLVKDTKFKNLTGVGKTVTLVANWNDVVVKLPSVTKDGYVCRWNTKADGTGTSISSGGDYTVSKNSTSATVYAICTENTGKNKYNIKYVLNGGTVTGNPTSAEYDVEVTINQPSKSVTVNCNENNTGATIGKSPVANLEFEGWTSPDVDTSTAMYGTTKWIDRATLVKDTKFKNLTPVNNGTVTMVANWKDGVVTLPSIDKKDHTCVWNTSSDGKGVSYKAGDKYTVDKNSVSVNMYGICVKNDSDIKNPITGNSLIIVAWIIGLSAIGFSVYYYMRRRNNI